MKIQRKILLITLMLSITKSQETTTEEQHPTYFTGKSLDLATNSTFWTIAKLSYKEKYYNGSKLKTAEIDFKLFRNDWAGADTVDLNFLVNTVKEY